MQPPTTRSKYGYICLFLLQLFMLVACGSYVNTAIVCVAWTVVVLSVNEHNIVICVLCSFSVVLHTYALSLNSQRVLLVRSPRQKACETMGITSLESVYRRDNVFRSCDTDFFVPFIPARSYSLERDPDTKLMYGPVALKNKQPTLPKHLRGALPLSEKNTMRMATCRELGISCYRWKIQVQGFGSRAFVPCWPLVSHIYSTNASSVSMLQHTPLSLASQGPSGAPGAEVLWAAEQWAHGSIMAYSLNISVPGPSSTTTTRDAPLVARHSSAPLFVHLSSQARMPLGLVHTHIPGTMQLDNVTLAPDSSTTFVVLPVHAGQHTSMQVVLSTRCGGVSGQSRSAQQPFYHSGVMHLAKAATPTAYTVYIAFSDCSAEEGCNTRLLTSFGVYFCNIALCVSCLVLTHSWSGMHGNYYSVVYVFALATAVMSFNWVCAVSVYFVHPASIQGGLLNLKRGYRVFFHLLHAVQLLLLVQELSRNRLGFDSHYILSRMHKRASPEQFLLPFVLLDSNVYIENCAIYLCSSFFVAYLLYGCSELPQRV